MRTSISFALVLALGCGTTPDSSSTSNTPANASTTTAPTSTSTTTATTTASAGPPRAKKEPTTRTLHGEAFVDDYFWMRNKDRPDVVEHLRAEASYTEATLAPLKQKEQALYDEIISHKLPLLFTNVQIRRERHRRQIAKTSEYLG
jgi:hypothetical protein